VSGYIGGNSNAVMQYNFANGSACKLFETMDSITALRYAPSGKFIVVGSKEGKAIIYEPQTGRK
jgi:tricorn protease-like protein